MAENGLALWWGLSCGGWAGGKDVSEACPLMNHYAEASGADWNVDVDDLLGSPEFKDAVDSSNAFVRDIAAAKCKSFTCTYTFDTGWKEMSFEESKSEDHYYGYRGMTYQVRGSVTVARGSNGTSTSTGTYSVSAFKAWNFDKNEVLQGVPFSGPAYAAGFGLAREFAVVGNSSQHNW